MTEENGGKYGKGFALRMTVLIGLLALVSGGLFYDRVILPKKAKSTIAEAYKLMTAPDEDGHGITKDQVQKTIGFEPESVTNIDNFDIERYSFKRALWFMKGDYLNVIYEDDALVQILQNQDYSPDKVKHSLGFRSAADPETYTGNEVQLGGVPRSSMPGFDEDEDSDEDSDEDADEDSDEDEKAEDDGEKTSPDEEAAPAKEKSEDGSQEEDKGSDEKEEPEKKDGAN